MPSLETAVPSTSEKGEDPFRYNIFARIWVPPVERLFFRRSLPARSTMKSLPTLTFWPTARFLGVVLGRFTIVSITMPWLRLDCAFSAVNATALQQRGLSTHSRMRGT